jgi:hypothetical protein
MVSLSKAFWDRVWLILWTAVAISIITRIYVQRPIERFGSSLMLSSREPPPPFQKPPVRSPNEVKALNHVLNPSGPDLVRWGSDQSEDPEARIGALFLALRSFEKGGISYHVLPKMRQGKEEQIQVRITKNTNERMLTFITHNLRPTVRVDKLRVAPYMVVQLHDTNNGRAFRISPLTAEKQSVVGDGYATWAWNVVPLESGQQTLYLSVGSRLKMPNEAEETQFEPLYARSINVQADRAYQTKRVLLGNWQWLIVTLLLPFVGYLRKRLKRKPKETELLP